MLCQACKDLLDRKSPEWKGSYQATFGSGDDADSNNWKSASSFDLSKAAGFVHHLSGRAFLAAAREGCLLCLRLESQLSPEERLAIAEEPDNIDTSSADYDYVVGYGEVFWHARDRVDWEHKWTYGPRTLNDAVENGRITMGLKFRSTDDHQEFGPFPPEYPYPTAVGQGGISTYLVESWIAACDEHDDCRLRSLSEVYKTQGRPRFARIIDVQNGSSDPRLSDVDELPAGATYMTLSHCWGDPKHRPLTLTLDTLVAFKAGIPSNKLPKTFADAIVFTRNLGIRYIWIDSLCIIQDSADDWEKESAVMCEIYSGSYLNLAATGAADSRGGLFTERDERSVRPLTVVHEDSFFLVVDDYEWHRQVEDAPLSQRGWVFQERALARRSLHFGSQQLYWECSSMRASERVPSGYRYGNLGFKTINPLLPHSTSTPAALVATWGQLVRNYASKGLTKETDKLVAISGLAKALAAQTGMQYLAGLWNYDLEQHLLWRAWGLPLSKRPHVFRSPSWSWASVGSDIMPAPAWKGPFAITILSVGASSVPSTETFTAFESRPLTIRGALVPGSLSQVPGESEPTLTLIRTHPVGGRRLGRRPEFFIHADSDSEQDNNGPILLLPIRIDPDGKSEWGKWRESDVMGLVLKATGAKGTLRRVGHFCWTQKRPPGHVPLRKLWLLDYFSESTDDAPDGETEDSVFSRLGSVVSRLGGVFNDGGTFTDPLEGVSEDSYHHYEEIGNSGDRMRNCLKEGFDWTRVYSGGFTFDLV